MAPIERYARKTLKRCEVGDCCECIRKSALELLHFYPTDLFCLQDQTYKDPENFQYFLEKLAPCFLRLICQLTYDMLKGRFIFDDWCSCNWPRILEHKQAALKICHPRNPNQLALHHHL